MLNFIFTVICNNKKKSNYISKEIKKKVSRIQDRERKRENEKKLKENFLFLLFYH